MGAGTWWKLPEDVLIAMLERAAAGEDPSILMLELDANCDTIRPGDEPPRDPSN